MCWRRGEVSGTTGAHSSCIVLRRRRIGRVVFQLTTLHCSNFQGLAHTRRERLRQLQAGGERFPLT